MNHFFCLLLQFADYDTLPKFKQSRVRFFHAGGHVANQVTVYLNNIQYTVLQPFEKHKYIDLDSKSYIIRVDFNSSKTLAVSFITMEECIENQLYGCNILSI